MKATTWACRVTIACGVLMMVACGGKSKPAEDTLVDEVIEEDVAEADQEEQDTPVDLIEDTGPECIATGAEECDGLDNDCDGEIDEDFDLINDDRNCGACGFICSITNGTAACVDSVCRIDECTEGFIDLNAASFDGCEYECTPTLELESVDDGTCTDTLDNDCDGRIDETDTDCSACVPEFCDTLDNDCDGLNDEDFDLQADPLNCGVCGNDCAVHPHSTPVCVMGACDVACEAGWVDEDFDALNGCEVRCVASPTLDETACDGIDADCDGLVDEDYIPDSCGTGACEVLAVCWHGAEECTPLDPAYIVDAVCDGLDEDCDGTADEDYEPSALCFGVCRDTAVCTEGVEDCGDPAVTEDLLCDALDEDCDGSVDEDYIPYTCGSGGCIRQSTCIGGVEDCITGGSTTEVCNGADDDCDGTIDNGVDASMCPAPAQVTTTDCVGGVCAIATCQSAWYDTNRAYIDGCECQQEANEAVSYSCPAHMVMVGDMTDAGTGSTQTYRGNIVPDADVDWYMFRAVDTADTSCDAFHVVVEFTSNAGNAHSFDVYRGPETDDCTAVAECVGEKLKYERAMDFRSGSGTTALGECGCKTTITSGFNMCVNETEYFFVKVYRTVPATTCDYYEIRIRNNPA